MKGGRYILNAKEIKKTDFSSIISQNEMNKYMIINTYIKKVTQDGIVLSMNICIPESDICYPINLTIKSDGVINVSLEEEI